MRTSTFLSLVSIIVAVGCATPPKETPADEADGTGTGSDAVSAGGDGTTATTGTTPSTASTAATSPDPSKVTVPPLPGGGATPVLPTQPPAGTPTLPPANPQPPANPPVDLATCYGQCLATKGAAILVFDACSKTCAEGDQACIDQCWSASGCEANEAVCQNAYGECDAQCPGDVGR